ncbi:uncharacterized protein LOC132732888 [Ruditapes philippinarum]|uniref:uncharacterized protein LOC132732888 n=1 Tax=Ruditapes philippinarum TaxID=129788 RepID=UPI00295A986C|nr:uncharacterized protein LOC132732888 [Ruditapes philippinarum]
MLLIDDFRMRTNGKVLVLVFILVTMRIVLGAASFDCYGDICNRGANSQFCSKMFKLCRDCETVKMSCGTEDQPEECYDYCLEYKVKLAVEKEKASNCSGFNQSLRGVVSFNQTGYQQGDNITINCGIGMEPQYTNTVECGKYGLYQIPYPRCEVQTCVLSPIVANAKFTPDLDRKGRVVFNTTVTVDCKDGFTLVGSNTMTCLADQMWNVEAPFCIPDTYIWWRTLAFGLIAVSATFFIVIIILIALFVWLHNRETRSIKTSKHSTQRKPSVSESGISSYHDHDEGETCKMIVDAKAGQQTPESNISRNSFTDSESCKSDQTTAALEERKLRSSASNVDITNINNTYNLYGNTSITHHTDPSNDTSPNNNFKLDIHPEDENTKEQVPVSLVTEESQITIEASQETQQGKSSKGAIPFMNDNDTDIALDSVPLILKKSLVDLIGHAKDNS